MLRFIQNNRSWLLLALCVALPVEAREPGAARGSAAEESPTLLSLAIGAAQVPDYAGSDDYKDITGEAADSPIVAGDTVNQILGALIGRRFQL